MTKNQAAKKKWVAKAMKHPDAPGAGAEARRQIPMKWRGSAVMEEFHRGTLRSGGSGNKVTNPKQAQAIAASESHTKAEERRWRMSHR
jgi:hypothetical protein